MKKITLCLIFAGFASFLGAQSVGLDSTFGVNGVVVTDLINYTSSSVFGTIVNLLPDGKIIVGGAKDQIFTIQRYHNSGAKDTTFLSLPSGLGNHTFGTAIQKDGKIIASAPRITAPFNHEVIRLEANGAIDSTFGNHGIASTLVGNFFASNLFEQTDGKIVVYACMYSPTLNYPAVVTRFNPNGTLDSTFALNGQIVLSVSADIDILNAGMELPDGKLLFAGMSGNSLFMFRLNANGSLDSIFGSNAILIDKFTKPGWAFAFALQSDGKIVVTGYQSALNYAIITRYHPDGSTDFDFGFQGVVYIQEAYKGVGISILPNGKIIAALRISANPDQVALIQLLPNGQRDMMFGTNGVFIPGINHRVRNLILSGNQVYVSAQTEDSSQISILRFLLDLNVGTLNPNTAAEPSLWVYPNPITEQFTLEFGLTEPAQVSAHLFDLQGKLVHALVQNQSFEHGDHALDLSCPNQLPAGNYVLILEVNGKNRESVQIMKK